MKPLTQSRVVFEERDHSYTAPDGRMLSGITGLIHSVLQLGVYPGADGYAQQVAIPVAGWYGKCVHRALQTWDDLGVRATHSDGFTFETHDYGDREAPAHDVDAELDSYIALKGDAKVLASEFVVDYGDYASCIDSVWQEGRNIVLVDFKTNNLDYYPGGEAGLKEYLSWQLSCYAFMFERQTRRKVKSLRGVWLRGSESKVWEIERQPNEQVECLLKSDCIPGEHGFTYFNATMQRESKTTKAVAATQSDLAVPMEVVDVIAELLEAEQKAKAMKARLRELMEGSGVTKWECDRFTATIGKASTRKDFDRARFIEDFPELWEQYQVETESKPSFRLKLK